MLQNNNGDKYRDPAEPMSGGGGDSSSGGCSRTVKLIACCFCVVGVMGVIIYLAALFNTDNIKIELKVENMMFTLNEFERIAGDFENSRSVTRGFNETSAFVEQQIGSGTDFEVKRQNFFVQISDELAPPKLEQVAPSPRSFERGTDFNMLSYSGSTPAGGVTGPVSKARNQGCAASDFTGVVTRGSVALIERGNCSFGMKVAFAAANGAVAAVVFNAPKEPGLFQGTLGEPASIAALGIAHSLGIELTGGGVNLTVFTSIKVSQETTSNLEVDTGLGDEKNTIVVGAHLDSVPAGPGINDNGSGAACVLELVMQLQILIHETLAKWPDKGADQWLNRVVVCFWGAEEIGLKGSEHWVKTANESGRLKDVALNLNFDMLASPNYKMGVYNGSSGPADGPDVLNGSVAIQKLLVGAILDENVGAGAKNVSLSEFNGRSDYGPFIAMGIPAGGIDTGAEGIKTMAERTKFGGMANAAYDPCYHQRCDTVENINKVGYQTAADSIAKVIVELAMKPNLREWLQLKGDPATYDEAVLY